MERTKEKVDFREKTSESISECNTYVANDWLKWSLTEVHLPKAVGRNVPSLV